MIEPILNNRPSPWDAYADYRSSLALRKDGAAPEALAAGDTQEAPETKRTNATEGCQTCKQRKYQDGSDDPGVSFKTPTRVAPEQAASAVRAHEMEHVGRNRNEATRENRKVVSQSVTYHNAICPECGRSYISGGTTRTVTRSNPEQPAPDPQKTSGGFSAYA